MSRGPYDALFAAIGDDKFLADVGLGDLDAADRAGELFDYLIEATAELAAQNGEQYDLVADQIDLGGIGDLRSKIGPAVLRDVADYDPRRTEGASRGRERLYWLAVALADRLTPAGQVDLQSVLRQIAETGRESYFPVYRRLAAAIGREPLDGDDELAFQRLQSLIHIFLEGVTAAQRAGTPPSEDDVVTAVMALFHAFTRRPGEDPFDPEVALVATDSATASPSQGIVLSADGEEASYGLAADAVDSLQGRDPGLIQYASLHGISGASRRDSHAPQSLHRLRLRLIDLLESGWRLHRLTTVHSEEDLDREIENASDLGNHGRVRVHATVGGIGGHAAAITVDGQFVVLGLDEPHSSYVGKALLIRDLPAVAFWAEHFHQVFDDRRHTLLVAGPGGLDQGGIAELRRRVRAVARLTGDVPAAIELTDRQREVCTCLGRIPRPQLQEIADELFISREAVKKHCEKLYDKFEIPPGSDRVGPLAEELRRRGIV